MGEPQWNADTRLSEGERCHQIIEDIVTRFPLRAPCSEDERAAQAHLAEQLEAQGASAELQPFRFSRNLYAVLALHFGLASIGTLLSVIVPIGGAVLHGVAGVSYLLDSTRTAYLLRRLLGWGDSQNLVATLPVKRPLRKRIVLIGHIDAAYTGLMFEPWAIRAATNSPLPKPLHFMRKGLLLATASCFLALGVDVLLLTLGPNPWLWALLFAVSLPAIITFILNLDVVLRSELVQGANDNLTGCAALVSLLETLERPDDVEFVLVATGCEESGTGGSYRLAQRYADIWSREDTVIIGLDSLTNGTLRYFGEGEVVPMKMKPYLHTLAEETNQTSDIQAEYFQIPSGGSDSVPWLRKNFDAVTFGCVDPHIGAPRGYHHPTDTVENLDVSQLDASLAYVRTYIERLASR